jgi:hypothetical protein
LLTVEHRDIVDTEPFEGGNVYKMLLGAIDPWYDGDDDEDEDEDDDTNTAPSSTAGASRPNSR